MKKQKLDINALAVESFPTTGFGGGRGTVFGHATELEASCDLENSCRAGCATQAACADPTLYDCIYPTPSCNQNGTYTAGACYSLVPHTDPRACCTDAGCLPPGTGGGSV